MIEFFAIFVATLEKSCTFALRNHRTGNAGQQALYNSDGFFYIPMAVMQYCIFMPVFLFTPTVSFAIPIPTNGHSITYYS
jgi:hypothetical protein